MNTPKHYSEMFRIPIAMEQDLGLWVDRIGSQKTLAHRPKLRVLGLFAAVAVTSGGGYYLTENGDLPVKAGDTMMVLPDVPSMYYPSEEWFTKYIVWGGPEAALLCKHTGLTSPVIPSSSHIIEEYWARLTPLMEREDRVAVLTRKKLLLDMIIQLTHLIGPSRQDGRVDILVEKAIRFIKESVENPFAITEVAEHCLISPSQLRRAFRRQTRQSPKAFANAVRMTRARQMLAQGESIKTTAHQLGYDDVCYFMRSFKRITGITAGQYRKQNPQ